MLPWEKYTNSIVNDLEASSKLFSNLPKQRGDYRINGTTVDILLSRVYLFMERYDETIAAADKAIQSAEGLTDYTALPGDTEFFMPTYDHSEVEWVYGAVSLGNLVSHLICSGEGVDDLFRGERGSTGNFLV